MPTDHPQAEGGRGGGEVKGSIYHSNIFLSKNIILATVLKRQKYNPPPTPKKKLNESGAKECMYSKDRVKLVSS
jgi:hypothetical protein